MYHNLNLLSGQDEVSDDIRLATAEFETASQELILELGNTAQCSSTSVLSRSLCSAYELTTLMDELWLAFLERGRVDVSLARSQGGLTSEKGLQCRFRGSER